MTSPSNKRAVIGGRKRTRKRGPRYTRPITLVGGIQKSQPDAPKTRELKDYPLQSDAGKSYLYGRDVRHLLRSVGHLFRDGRWNGTDSRFHVYREIESPGLGSRQAFTGGSYFRDFVVRSDTNVETFNWVPSIARGFVASDAFSTYEEALPSPTVPDTNDWTLTLNGLGTDFVRRFRPGNPVANLGEFIIELRDLPRLPLLLRSKAKRFSDLGSEYLNVEFGWKPFVADLLRLQNLQFTIFDRLQKLIKDNGIRVKRRSRHEFRTLSSGITSRGSLEKPFGLYNLDGNFLDPPYDTLRALGPVPFGFFDAFMTGENLFTVSAEHVTESWYVGTYYYYVPDIGSQQWTGKAIAELYGVSPHPAVIYRTYPWTWLADWFFNIGDILSNLSSNAVDSEALGGGYVMHKSFEALRVDSTIRWDDFDFNSAFPASNEFAFITGGQCFVTYSHIRVNKLRSQASPFGFGLRPGEFTTRQEAILLALAASRKVPDLRSTVGGKVILPGRGLSLPVY